MKHTATYSPDDNKLRIYPAHRLDKPDYEALRSVGYKWAPKQELFVCPRWTPAAEDVAIQYCGEIGDEDTSLVDRAEQRAERFEDYSDKRAAESDQAHEAVRAIADNIPFGQPILVGHHSEKHARRDAKRIDDGMRKAVKLWDTSKYWQQRAAGALAHAKYKERPDVRARRIKTIEADKRKAQRENALASKFLKTYQDPEAQTVKLKDGRELIPALLGTWEGGLSYDDQRAFETGKMTREDAQAKAIRNLSSWIAHRERWLAHYDNRLAYEKAMLGEQGASDLLKPKPKPKQLPLCNYRAPSGSITVPNRYRRGDIMTLRQVDMTKAEYAKIYADYKGTHVVENSHRIRSALHGEKRELVCVFLTDSKVHVKPAAVELHPATRAIEPRPTVEREPENTQIEAMRESLRQGVQTVVAPQLFPTPAHLAERMVELAEIGEGQRILEPSGGTGAIIRAIQAKHADADLTAVEIKAHLADVVRTAYRVPTYCKDFLQMNGEAGKFDRILMNPPFENASDIKHIEHARSMLNPGGRIVAICANGPRQQERLKPIAAQWQELPAGTFKESGTMVNSALIVIESA